MPRTVRLLKDRYPDLVRYISFLLIIARRSDVKMTTDRVKDHFVTTDFSKIIPVNLLIYFPAQTPCLDFSSMLDLIIKTLFFFNFFLIFSFFF